MARTLLSSLIILILAVVLVQGRFLSDDDGELVSDGVHEHYHDHAANNQSVEESFLALGGPRVSSSSASSTCDHAYGFFPCAENIPGYLFQIVIFQYLMSVAEQLVSSSSKKIFDTLGTGIFGATVFRILMVFPRIIMTISSGIFNSQEGAQNQVFFGIRVNAGATIFNLTILWGLCVIVGRRDRAAQENKDSQSQPETQSFASSWLKNLTECGISTDASTSFTAGLMLLSLVPFVLVELVNVVSSASGQRIVVLVALIITVAFLLAYFAYQIIDPTIQKRSLHYSRFENLLTQNGKPNVSRIRLFYHLYDSDNNEQMSSQELEKFLRLIVTDEVQRMTAVRTMMKDLDVDGNSRITEQEFLNGIENLLANNSSADNAAAIPTSTPENDQEKTEEVTNGGAAGEVEPAGGNEILTWDFLVTVLQVILGVVILTFCAQPLMTNVISFSGAVGVPTFIISFVVLPIVINGRMAIAAIFPASQKSSKAASLTFSEIYNGVTMSNLTGLLSLLAVVYARELTWDYSAEVLVVFVISLTIGFLAYCKTTYQLWTSIFAFFLYPFSLALFYVLQLMGWD
nr:sodium/calcium exchanger NCL-like [Ipomoea batatas]